MKITLRPPRQRGVAAVEFAVILPLLVLVLLAAPLSMGRILWHYTVAQKAAHDAARYLATVPDGEMRTPALAPLAVQVARDIAEAELADLNPGPTLPAVSILCNGINCTGAASPTTVHVNVLIEVSDPIFGMNFGSEFGLLISADVTLRSNGAK